MLDDGTQRVPTACVTPTISAALSLVIPVAICSQNRRSTSRRSDGAPGERIAPRPVNSCIHPAGRPINTSKNKVLRRPVESAQFTAEEFTRVVLDVGSKLSMDGRGAWRDNVFVERLWRSVKYERVYLKAYDSVSAARTDIAEYLTWYNAQRSHSSLGRLTPNETYFACLQAMKLAA